MTCIIVRTSVDAMALNSYLVNMLIQPDHVELEEPDTGQPHQEHDADLRGLQREYEIESHLDHEPDAG